MQWKLLEGVPDDEVRRLLSVARRRSFRKGEVVFHRGDPADSLHLISKGRFKVQVMTPLGEPATIAIRGPGDFFGEMAVAGPGHKRSATIEALEDAETFCVTESEFRRLRKEHAGIDQLLIDFLANEVRMLNERLLEALYVPAERRVLRRLAEHSADARGARRPRRHLARDRERGAERAAGSGRARGAPGQDDRQRPARARRARALTLPGTRSERPAGRSLKTMLL